MKLWQKSSKASLHPLIQKYTVGDDLTNDLTLFPYDIEASKAHAESLREIDILTPEETDVLLGGLSELLNLYKEGNIIITSEDEDGHTVIENYLTKNKGDAGKKIHTGRSRNDQSLVALRLYMKDQLSQTKTTVLDLATALLNKADQYDKIPLPGYSHTQQAMLISVGHYFCSIAESLLDDIDCFDAIKLLIDKNPLGSAAGFGVSFPLDRQYTTKKLGFQTTQHNSLYCQSSRGKFESLYLEALVQVMMTLGTFATDIIFFTSRECNFFEVEESLVTGSSIMPQKRNLDGLEILRGNVSVVSGNHSIVQGISKGLMSGYHRDYQLIKKLLIDSSRITKQSIEVATLYTERITPNAERIKEKITKDIFMADKANDLVKEKGIPFRDAYTMASELPESTIDFNTNIASKLSPGAPGNLGIDALSARLESLR